MNAPTKIFSLLLAACMSISCGGGSADGRISEQFDIQGHRGCRGLMPENSIAGFVKAVKLGVTTLEMDVVISADRKVIVSHEPYMSHTICLDSTGNEIRGADEKSHNIFEMTYEEILRYDCGSKGNPGYPSQMAATSTKPTLPMVLETIEYLCKELGLPKVHYNIETKSAELGDNVFHPEPEEFVRLVLEAIDEAGVRDRTIIQSFDPRTLNVLHDIAPEIRTALLVTNQLGYRHNLQRLDFKPTIFSPNKIFLTAGMIDFMHEEGIQVIPWTVNKKERMRELIDMGVDGIITDYPDILIDLVQSATD